MRYRSSNKFRRVGLCLSFVPFLRLGITRVGGGVPMRSRASSFTAVTARNRFAFFLPAIALFESPGVVPFRSRRLSLSSVPCRHQFTACARDFVQ